MTKRLGSRKSIGPRNDGSGVVGLPTHGDDRILLRVSEIGVCVIGSVEDSLTEPFTKYGPIFVTTTIYLVKSFLHSIEDTIRHNFTPFPGRKPTPIIGFFAK